MAKLPEPRPLPVKNKNAANVRSDSEKLLRALIVLFILMAVAVALLIGALALRKVLFSSNPRFALREVQVQTEGYWKGREWPLAARLGVHRDENLFNMNPGELRRRLAAIPSVEYCEVTRVLPDTLKLRVGERIPRAVLGNPLAEWVIDEKCVVIPRLESMSSSPQLPVVLGLGNRTFEAGMKLAEFEPAMELIMLTVLHFPDIAVFAVNTADKEKITLFVRYRNRKVCQAIIPVKGRNFHLLLTALQSAILHAEQRGDSRGTFDLSFDGNVIVR